jgi:polysaccharide deacetylase 2 family uncharacterized protein YibQ
VADGTMAPVSTASDVAQADPVPLVNCTLLLDDSKSTF